MIPVTRVSLLLVAFLLVSGCGTSAGTPQPTTSTSLITFEDLADPTVDIEGATGIDLGEHRPDPAGFCDAFDAAPSRWLQDALVPIQLWVGNFEGVDAPDGLAESVTVLLDYGRDRLRWNFTGGERPPWESQHETAERTVAEWATENCELSPVIGPWAPGIPSGWADLSPEEIEDRCAEEEQRVRDGQEEYRELTGRYAGHVIALETHLEIFWASDDFYVTAATADSYELAPIPEGACDSDS